MGYFDDMFKSGFMFDSEYRQRADIEHLKQAIADSAPDLRRVVMPLIERVDRLELTCKVLTELIVSKGVATPEELSIVAQQLDLEDGVEDGKLSSSVRDDAPRCTECGRFVNPRRKHCVYCHALVTHGGAAPPPPVRMATCGDCLKEVPEADTFYTGNGLRCSVCYDPADA